MIAGTSPDHPRRDRACASGERGRRAPRRAWRRRIQHHASGHAPRPSGHPGCSGRTWEPVGRRRAPAPAGAMPAGPVNPHHPAEAPSRSDLLGPRTTTPQTRSDRRLRTAQAPASAGGAPTSTRGHRAPRDSSRERARGDSVPQVAGRPPTARKDGDGRVANTSVSARSAPSPARRGRPASARVRARNGHAHVLADPKIAQHLSPCPVIRVPPLIALALDLRGAGRAGRIGRSPPLRLGAIFILHAGASGLIQSPGPTGSAATTLIARFVTRMIGIRSGRRASSNASQIEFGKQNATPREGGRLLG